MIISEWFQCAGDQKYCILNLKPKPGAQWRRYCASEAEGKNDLVISRGFFVSNLKYFWLFATLHKWSLQKNGLTKVGILSQPGGEGSD